MVAPCALGTPDEAFKPGLDGLRAAEDDWRHDDESLV